MTAYRINEHLWQDEETWQDLMCITRCMKLADVLIDGEPFCMDCAEEQTDYFIACSENPQFVHMMPAPHLRD